MIENSNKTVDFLQIISYVNSKTIYYEQEFLKSKVYNKCESQFGRYKLY